MILTERIQSFLSICLGDSEHSWHFLWYLFVCHYQFKVILKIFQARLQQYVNFQMFKLVSQKAEEPEIKLPPSAGSSKKQESSRKNIYFCFINYAKAFDCVDHNKLWKILQEMRIPDHLTCLLRNLYAGQEAAVKTGHGTTDWF